MTNCLRFLSILLRESLLLPFSRTFALLVKLLLGLLVVLRVVSFKPSLLLLTLYLSHLPLLLYLPLTHSLTHLLSRLLNHLSTYICILHPLCLVGCHCLLPCLILTALVTSRRLQSSMVPLLICLFLTLKFVMRCIGRISLFIIGVVLLVMLWTATLLSLLLLQVINRLVTAYAPTFVLLFPRG